MFHPPEDETFLMHSTAVATRQTKESKNESIFPIRDLSGKSCDIVHLGLAWMGKVHLNSELKLELTGIHVSYKMDENGLHTVTLETERGKQPIAAIFGNAHPVWSEVDEGRPCQDFVTAVWVPCLEQFVNSWLVVLEGSVDAVIWPKGT